VKGWFHRQGLLADLQAIKELGADELGARVLRMAVFIHASLRLLGDRPRSGARKAYGDVLLEARSAPSGVVTLLCVAGCSTFAKVREHAFNMTKYCVT